MVQLKISVYIGEQYTGTKIIDTPCVIGRFKEAGFWVPNPSVSRKHCELFEENGTLYLRDFGSLNGTLLMGSFVEGTVPTQIGEEFVIGKLLFRIDSLDQELPNEKPFQPEAAQSGSSTDSYPTMINENAIDDYAQQASYRIPGNCFRDQDDADD